MNQDRVQALVKKFGTPLYCFDEDQLVQRIQYLKKALPSNVELCYAAKANTFLIPSMDQIIDHYEICSPGEYRICKKLDISNQKIVLSGVYKKKTDLEEIFGSKEDLPVMTIESIQHFKMIEALAKQTQRLVKIMLRLTSGNQFGLDLEEVKELIQTRDQYPWLEYVGIQYFSGTQKHSQKRIVREMDYLEEVLKELKIINYQPSVLEYGPGFPVDYFTSMHFDEKEHLAFFSQQLMRFEKMTVILELGRSIAATCGRYITQIVDKKINKGQNYLIVDGGIHHLVYYGQGIAMKLPPFTFISSCEGKEEKPWNICGALCTVNDILMKQVPLAEPEIGDLFVFENTGAYCPTEGMSLFLTRDLPAVCLMNRKQEKLVRDHTSVVDLNAPIYREKGE